LTLEDIGIWVGEDGWDELGKVLKDHPADVENLRSAITTHFQE